MRSHLGATVVFVLLVVSGGLVAWRALTYGAPGAAQGLAEQAGAPVAVEVAPIESGLMRDIRELSGSLQAFTRFDVAAKVGGRIQSITVDLGDEVRRGQVVAQLDDEEFVQARAQAKAELAVREAELAQAQAELDRVQYDFNRIKSLHDSGVATELEFNQITTQLASQQAAVALAEARVRQAQAALEVADIRLGYTAVRASWQGGPDLGTVGTRYEDAGDTIQAGDPILAVVALDPLTAVVSVTEGDYAQLEIGQTATLMTDARPGETFEAEVARIAPIFQEASRQARIELRVTNPRHVLRPGMFIRVRVVLREAEADTIVPSAAIVQRRGEDVVFTVDEAAGVVRAHAVETGIARGDRVEIVRPPLRGQVVVLGQHLLEDGSPIKITATAQRGEE